VIDLHSHVLPGLDDGPDHIEASVALARAAATAGTATLVATPHIRGDYPFDPARILPAVEELNARLVGEGISLEVVPGGEVSITSLLEIDDSTLDAVRLGGGPYVLVESPYTHTGELLERTLFEAQIRGLRPLLAHPERSPCFLGDLDRMERVVDRGVLSSVTAGSMAGRFGKPVYDFTVLLFERGLVHDVASDAHGAERRPPGLLAGFERLDEDLPGLLDQADWFTRAAPGAILRGEELPPRPDAPGRRRRGFGRLVASLGRRGG